MNFQATRSCAALALLAWLSPALSRDSAADQSLVVIDLRPAEEKQGKGLAPLTGECNADVYRIADTASNPAKVKALQADLAGKLGAAAGGSTLTVLNWTIYYNRQLYGGQPSTRILPMPGGAGIPLPGHPPGNYPGSKCSRQESAGGWFDRTEVTGKHSPLVSVFEGTFGGIPVGVRIVHSPQHDLGKFTGDARDSAAVLAAVRETADALAAVLPVPGAAH
jgi:hypothetical protein